MIVTDSLARIAAQVTPKPRRIRDRDVILGLLKRRAMTAREVSERTGIRKRVVWVHLSILKSERLIYVESTTRVLRVPGEPGCGSWTESHYRAVV